MMKKYRALKAQSIRQLMCLLQQARTVAEIYQYVRFPQNFLHEHPAG